jgi:hypothetical protein
MPEEILLTCEHENRHVETDEDYNGYKYRLYVCDDCGQDIPRSFADPDEDYADYKANMREDY